MISCPAGGLREDAPGIEGEVKSNNVSRIWDAPTVDARDVLDSLFFFIVIGKALELF